ncbi:hypothetical protein SCHPADRAFT_888942 [Schizopora paradoxa]|uniref:Mid2 domain-containing protein n=1 Tax=Schizopora paradoxa TaxID=27342 RepID=A0A0H2RTN0_9AGAM|nr:hypothetical protein SCHPADRAFT_888942 [Schizopora paradoxa]
MSEVCVSSATSTQFGTITSNSVSTSFSSSVTTLAGSVTTIASTSCLSSSTPTGTGGGSPTCVSSTVINSVSTIAGAVSTVQVPVVTTIPVVVTQATATLFGSSCSTVDSGSTPNSSPTPDSTSPTNSPTSPTNSPTSPTSTPSSTSSPSTTAFTTEVTVIQGTTVTSIVPLSSVQPDSGSSGSHSSSNLGPILGGIFGGVFGLVLIVGVIWWILRRRSRWDDIFDEKEGYEDTVGADGIRHTRSRGNMLDTEFAADANTEPKPYEYGLVGAGRPMSPPSENLGVRPISQQAMHGRTLSDAPLIMGNVASASTGHLLTPSSTSHASRPSTSSSYFLPGQGPSDVGHSPRHTGSFANAPGSGAAPNVPPLPSPPATGVVPTSFSAQQPNPSQGGLGSPTRNSTVYEDSLLGSPPQQHRTLFVANQLEGERAASPPVSPKTDAFAKGKKRDSAGVASRTSAEVVSGSSSPRPMSPQRQSTSAVIVHKDAGRASTDVPSGSSSGNQAGNNSAPGGSGSGDAPPPAYAE